MMRGIGKSPFALMSVAASLMVAVACSDDDDDGGGGGDDDTGGKGGSMQGGSSGSTNGGTSGSSTGGATGGTGRGGTNTGGTTGGTNTGGANTGGSAGAATGGSAGTSGAAGGGDDGGMGGIGGTDGGMGGEGGEEMVPDVLDNGNFEMFGAGGKTAEIPGWQESGDLEAGYLEWEWGVPNPGGGVSHRLAHWRAFVATTMEKYNANTFQTVSPIPNGTYTFKIWVQRQTGALDESWLFARGHDVANPSTEMTVNTPVPANTNDYFEVVLPNIVVTSNQVTVGVHTMSWGNHWANFDNASLTKDP
ncbi:MAG TPA: hypothetical protein VFZ53_24295 [Polyangiaceae bacterium]